MLFLLLFLMYGLSKKKNINFDVNIISSFGHRKKIILTIKKITKTTMILS
jgi:hypothetical protein